MKNGFAKIMYTDFSTGQFSYSLNKLIMIQQFPWRDSPSYLGFYSSGHQIIISGLDHIDEDDRQKCLSINGQKAWQEYFEKGWNGEQQKEIPPLIFLIQNYSQVIY